MDKTIIINYHDHDTPATLAPADQELVQCAMCATEGAYSPYSHFAVGAAVRMADGRVVQGSNQENIAYPSGLCAERVALFAASAQCGPAAVVQAIAVVGRAGGRWVEASPCGSCRQVMAETESRQRSPIKVLIYLESGKIRVVDSALSLLPLAFSATLG